MADLQDTPMAGAAEAQPAPTPTARELELLRLLELKQQEVDDLSSTLTVLTQNPTARPPPLSLPLSEASTAGTSPATQSADQQLVIPRALLPILARLRAHSAALATQNKVLLSIVTQASTESEADGGGDSGGAAAGQGKRRKVNLVKVVEQLRVLSQENRELEGIVENLGRQVGEAKGLTGALEEAHETILALDSDLERSYGQIEALQAILAGYEARFGPLPVDSPASGSVPQPMST